MTDPQSLVAALLASGPLDNETEAAVDQGRAPSLSICDSIMEHNEPSVGVVVHEAQAELDGQSGIVFVIQRADGSREVRMYGTAEADPATGGCPLWIRRDIS